MGKQNNDYTNVRISDNIKTNLAMFKDMFRKDSILRIRQFKMNTGAGTETDCCLIYFDGMVSSELINESIIKPLILVESREEKISISLSDYVEKEILFASELKQTSCVTDILRGILYGDTALFLDGCQSALVINTKGFNTRGISEPADERILQGPREGFQEAAMFNLAMILRKLQTPDLCIETQRIGRRTDTMVFICYLESLTDPATLALLKERLDKIDIDGILDVNYLNEQIRDHPHSFFKTTGTTERPDIVAARLLEGRIAVVVDGTPVVLTLPYLFTENFQSDEDYYLNHLVASVGRVLRYICFFLAISVPAVYFSLITYHEQLIPTMFALSIAQARGGVPLSSFSECILVIIIFEILKETGARMPQSLGHALGIVGGLVIGQAAVEAKIISAPMLIAVALSGIGGLMIPRLKGIVFYGRLALLLLSFICGFYGYLLGISALLIYILSLDSFGVDYTISLLNPSLQGLKDVFWRASWQKMKTRPLFNRNITRAGNERDK